MLLLADFPYWRMPYCEAPLYVHSLQLEHQPRITAWGSMEMSK